MSSRIEIALKPEWFDSEGETLSRKAQSYFNISIDSVRIVNILTIDADLSHDQLQRIQGEIFTNPVTQYSSLNPLNAGGGSYHLDWIPARRPRQCRCNSRGSHRRSAGNHLFEDQAVYTSKRYCLQGKALTAAEVELIVSQLLANDIIQQWKIFSASQWDPAQGVGLPIPKVRLNHTPTVAAIAIDSDEHLMQLSISRNLALNPMTSPSSGPIFLMSGSDPSGRRWDCPIPPISSWSISPRRAATTATTIPSRVCFTTGIWHG